MKDNYTPTQIRKPRQILSPPITESEKDKAVILNLNGTLANSRLEELKFLNETCEEFGLGIEIHSTPCELESLKFFHCKNIKELLAHYNIEGYDAELVTEKYYDEFMKQRKIPLFNGAQELLQNLDDNNIHIGLLTYNPKDYVKRVLGKDILGLFNRNIVYVGENSDSKEQSLRYAANSINIPKRNLIYVGDTYDDLSSARGAEVYFIGVGYGNELTNNDLSFPIARDIKELEEIILERFQR